MNLYLPVYKRLEDEVISLTQNIFFDDDQLSTYSLSIADIIIRCSIEIEAIAKELYVQLGGDPEPKKDDGTKRDLYFDTDCMALLVEKWKIDKKQLQISNPNMYFSQEKAVLTPLHKSHKRGTSGAKWNQAYQAIKHNRTQSIKHASVVNMLNALGALYILNLYYADDVIASSVFEPMSYDGTHIRMHINMGDRFNDPISEEAEKCCYMKKVQDASFNFINKSFCRAQVTLIYEIMKSARFEKCMKDHPEYEGKPVKLISDFLGDEAYRIQKRELIKDHVFSKVRDVEEIVWKGQEIYPELTYEGY